MQTLDNDSTRLHKYLRLAKHFREQVRSGVLKPGDRLPSFAQMQAEHGIGQGTLERAYALLEEERIIIREPNRGTYVAHPTQAPVIKSVGFATGLPPRACPYYMLLLEGIQEAAYRERIELILLNDLDALDWRRFDGVVMTGQHLKVPASIPFVSLIISLDDVPCVLTDDYEASRGAVEYLAGIGHRRIALLSVGGTYPYPGSATRRFQGHCAGLKEAGLAPQDNWIRALRDPWEPLRGFEEMGYEKMTQWLREDWKALDFTAIIAHNDDTARGILRALAEAGIEVPGQVSVMGFDGSPVADMVSPRLTTMQVPLREIGEAGLELLLEVSTTGRSEGDAPPRRIFPARLKVQDSTAPPAK